MSNISNINDMIDALAVGDENEDETDAGGQSRLPRMRETDFVSERYNMNHHNRGVAVLINNKNFHPKTGMGIRTGTDVDADAMYKLLDTLGFQVIWQYNDQKASDIRDILKKASKVDHTDNDCFVCVILTHGEEGYVFGTDDKIPVDELVQPFKGHICPSLAGKPKLFFIQACRGTTLDQGVNVHDGPEAMEEEVVRRIPTEADFLMAYSVISGYFSWRNTANGSWFIQALFDVIDKNWKTMDLLTMLTRVNKKVAYDFESNASIEFMRNKKQIPCITSMLTKDVYFAKEGTV